MKNSNEKLFATSKDAIEYYGLDYKIEKWPVFAQLNSPPVEIPDKYATMRLDTIKPLGVVGSVYTVVQNIDAFDFIDTIAAECSVLFNLVKEIDDGRMMVVKAQLGDEIGIQKDTLRKTLLLTNSHDGSSKVRVQFNIENKSNNTLLSFSLPNIAASLDVKHTTNMGEKLTEGKRTITSAHAAFKQVFDIFHKMDKLDLILADVVTLVHRIINPKNKKLTPQKQKMINAIVVFFNSKNTISLWEVYTSIAEYIDTKTKKNGKDNINYKWFGGGNAVKEESFSQIVKTYNL